MATLGTSGKYTLLDWSKSLDPSGRTAKVAELLNQSNEALLDMPFFEGNLPTGHRSSVRTGLPTAIWRQMYQGVPASKSVRAQVEDSCGLLEARAEVDCDLVRLNGNEAAFRLSEAQAFVEAMNQTMASTLFYGDTSVNPERFMGLAPRFSAISGATNGVNVINGGGSGSDNTSVWLVVWGQNTVHGIFPKGTMAGLEHKDLGEYDAFDSNNNRYRVVGDMWKWRVGLVVRDWRYVVRVCNIDVSDLIAGTGSQNAQQLIKSMVRTFARIPFRGMGTPVFYANRTVVENLAIQALDKSQNVLKVEDGIQQFGQVTPGYTQGSALKLLGVPIRTVDRLLNTEATIS